MTMRSPDYDGGGLVNLIAELEFRLTGQAPSPRLRPELAEVIPTARSFVFVLFDGLGDHQLGHPAAAPLLHDRVGSLDASFSTQTTVNTSTLATGLSPSQHGLIAYLLRFNGRVVNTIFWFDSEGRPTETDYPAFLPAPNLSERLAAAGAETIVVEPSAFVDSPLEEVLYRGATIVSAENDAASIRIALERAAQPGKLVAVYVPHVDAAAHAAGQESALYPGNEGTMIGQHGGLTEAEIRIPLLVASPR